jgi:deoxyribonuclease-2
MGCCISNQPDFKNKIVLKFPHGKAGIEFCDEKKCFINCTDINVLLKNIYKKTIFTNWIIYNDQMDKIKTNEKKIHMGHGHCKGIIAWNDQKISWLCHSVPQFPSFFDGEKQEISDIDQSEILYGQSFQYIEIPYHNEKLIEIVQQLDVMDASIVTQKNHLTFPKRKNDTINIIILSDTITHIAKSPKHQIDIYSQSIGVQYPYNWKVESWMRGQIITSDVLPYLERVRDIKKLQYDNLIYREGQDHSKWAVSDSSFYCIGDLNRMTSQYNRGGGGLICDNKDIAESLRKLICE